MAYLTWSGASTGNAGTAGNYSTGSAPVDGDELHYTAVQATNNVTLGLDQSAIQLDQLIMEEGCSTLFGSESLGYLQWDVTDTTGRFEYHGGGQAYIDVGNSIVSPQIFNTFRANTGLRGLYLKGTAIATLSVMGGQVGLASRPGEVSTATTVRVTGRNASVWIGEGVTLTNLHVEDGECELRCAATTVIVYGGKLTTREAGAITNLTTYGGQTFPESTGTITNLTINGGLCDMLGSGAPRTVTTPTVNGGEFRFDPQVVTLTNKITLPSGGPFRVLGSRIGA